MNRKKIILLAASTLTAATIAVGGTLAYFTSKTAIAANTFTVGDVSITLNENEVTRTSSNKFELTSTPTTSGTSYANIYPGAYLPKNPQITVSQASEDCYVRMIVTVPNYSAMDNAAQNVFDTTFGNISYNGWVTDTTRSANGKYYLNYTGKVLSGQTTALPKAFEGISIPAGLTKSQLDSMAVDGTITVNVMGEAIQAETFKTDSNTDVQAQEAAYAALDTLNTPATPSAVVE